jgi:hypothetical protein
MGLGKSDVQYFRNVIWIAISGLHSYSMVYLAVDRLGLSEGKCLPIRRMLPSVNVVTFKFLYPSQFVV